jgi:two-component system, NarL family, sensor kinase
VALGLFGVVVAATLSWLTGAVITHLSFAAAQDSFMISNAVIGIGCGICGLLIAGYRPDNRLGWLLLAAGIAQNGAAAVTPWLIWALESGAATTAIRGLATAYSAAWPLAVSLFIPLAVLHFPDGRLPGPRWRGVAVVAAVNSIVQVLLFSADPNPLATVGDLGPSTRNLAASYLQVPVLSVDGRLNLISNLVLAATYLAAFVGLVLRYRRGDERTRRQLLWLLFASMIATMVILGERLLEVGNTFPIILTSTVALVPVAMTIAVLRHQLLDIRLVWSRAVTYLLLTVGVVMVYLLVVELADRLLAQRVGLGSSVAAALLVAVTFNPVRVRLQRMVERLLYGERSDPVRAASAVTAQLASVGDRPADVLPALCAALRLPYASLADGDDVRVEHGTPPAQVEVIGLFHDGRRVGELTVGVRSGQRSLARADRAVLELLAVPIGVALRARALSTSLQRSRSDLIAAREEERRRIRRDLHDGLGPLLTGIAFQSDALITLTDEDLEATRALAEEIRTGVTGAITDVRELINQLHPSMLDELGLVEAVRRHTHRLNRRSDGEPITVTLAAEPLPELSAAVEVAAYRIVTEALTNVARHSDASRVDIEIAASAAPEVVRVTVADNGSTCGSGPAWTPGVGLRSMRDRALELGGTLLAEPTPGGGRVTACLPTGGAP